MTFLDFLGSPGFGGVCAVIAALVVGASAIVVSRQRQAEAHRTATDAERAFAIEQWWRQYAWLVSTEADRLPFEGRVEILVRLIRTAEGLSAQELTSAARVYAGVLRRWIDQRHATQERPEIRSGVQNKSLGGPHDGPVRGSVEREVAAFDAGRRAAARSLLEPAVP